MSKNDELMLLSKIRPGETYSPYYRSIVAYRGWTASIWRTYRRESAQQIATHIKSVLELAIAESTHNPLLLDALAGCRNLLITYKDDPAAILSIHSVINTVESQLPRNIVIPDELDFVIVDSPDIPEVPVLPEVPTLPVVPEVPKVPEDSPRTIVDDIFALIDDIVTNLYDKFDKFRLSDIINLEGIHQDMYVLYDTIEQARMGCNLL